MARIGFVGLGHMGLPMAINLLKHGHEVMGFDLNQEAMDAWVKAGGKTGRLQDIAIQKDIVITMLQNGVQVQSVCLSENGLFSRCTPQTLYVDCSSIDMVSTRTIQAEAKRLNILALDAPVSGGVAGAMAGTLTFMVGGMVKGYKAIKPILSCMGKTIVHAGKGGCGQAAKICNNMILGVSMIAISEAFVLAQKIGLSPEKLFEVVTNSSGQCWAMSHYAPVPGLLPHVPANHEYQPGFTAAMMLKDLNLSQDSATMVGLETPIAAMATKLYEAFIHSGRGDLDFSAIIKTIHL